MQRPKQYKPAHARYRSKKQITGREESKKLYNSWWEKYRIIFLRVNSTCYVCGDYASVVDHIIPHKGDFTLFWKEDNYAPLCQRDHNTITNMFDRKHTPGTYPTKKLEYMSGMRMVNDVTVKVKIVPFKEDLLEWITKERLKGNESEDGGSADE